MDSFSFPGTFTDSHGAEQITWLVTPRERQDGLPSYSFETTIRGVDCCCIEFSVVAPYDPDRAVASGLPLNYYGQKLSRGVIQADLPCTVERDGRRTAAVVTYTERYRDAGQEIPGPDYQHPLLTLTAGDLRFEVQDGRLGAGVLSLDEQAARRAGARLVCCATCSYSGYHRNSLLGGLLCHRGAKEQFLAASDFEDVPVTEQVLETYLCPEYQQRAPGTVRRA